MGCALADWRYSKHRQLSAKDNTRAQGARVSLHQQTFIGDGAFFFSKWKQPHQAASLHCCSKDHVGRFEHFTPLTANSVPLTLESPILWMDLLLFTCFVSDFLFTLIDINSQSFGLSAVYLLFSASNVFAVFSLEAEQLNIFRLMVLLLCLGLETSQVLSLEMLLFLRHKVTSLYSRF